MSKKNGAPYAAFSHALRRFMDEKGYLSPTELCRDLQLMLGACAPSNSAIWMAFYGQRTLPIETILFMQQRFGFKVRWEETYPTKDRRGSFQKHNQLYLPGMRELRAMRAAQSRPVKRSRSKSQNRQTTVGESFLGYGRNNGSTPAPAIRTQQALRTEIISSVRPGTEKEAESVHTRSALGLIRE